MDNETLQTDAAEISLDFSLEQQDDATNGNDFVFEKSTLNDVGFGEGAIKNGEIKAEDSNENKIMLTEPQLDAELTVSDHVAVGELQGEAVQAPAMEDSDRNSMKCETAGNGQVEIDAIALICPPPPVDFQDDTNKATATVETSGSEQVSSVAVAGVNESSVLDQQFDLAVNLAFEEAEAEIGVELDVDVEGKGSDISLHGQGLPSKDSVAAPVDAAVCIELESKNESCYLGEPTVQAAAETEPKDEDTSKLNPEEEEAAIKFLQLQEQKKQEDDFDDEFDVDNEMFKTSATVPPSAALPKVTADLGASSKSITSTTQHTAEERESRSIFYDKETADVKTQVLKTSTKVEASVFYTDNVPSGLIEKKAVVGDSMFYAPAEVQNSGYVGGNGDVIARPMTAGKEITQLSQSDTSRPSDAAANGFVVDPNERSQDYALNGSANETNSRALQAAKAEWDTVETITPALDGEESDDSVEGITGAAHVKTTPSITYEEGYFHLRESNLTRYKAQIRQTVQRGAWGSFKHAMFGPPKLNKSLLAEKEMVFLIAACPFDNREEPHFQILQTIYKKLTGSKFDCQRYGDHWELVGFQGTDPSTDLRATGLLGLLTVLYLITDQKTWPLARDIYKLSLHETQNFPFCVMSINMVRIALQSLREESLNKECNKQQTVMKVFNEIYAGCFLHMYQIWKSQHKTIKDSGFVIKDVETFVKKNPKAVLKNLETFLSDQGSCRAAILEDGNIMNFAGVCEMGGNDDGDLV